LEWIHAEMYRRFPLMEAGQNFELTNFVVDEWRLINMNVKAIKEKNESGILVEIAPSAKAMMKDIITVSRESMLRLIALAQGEQVQTWGFEGESDLEECFTDIRLGDLAIDYARSLRGQCRKDSEEYHYWTAVLSELEWQESRRTSEGKSIPCCLVGKIPARIPDLSKWKRECVEDDSEDIPTQLVADDLSDDLTWNQQVLGMSEEEKNKLIEERRTKAVSPNPDTLDTTEGKADTADTDKILSDTPLHKASEASYTEGDTYLDKDTYTSDTLIKDFPGITEQELFNRIQRTELPPGRFIKEELKCTKPEKYRAAQKAINYLLRKYGNFQLMEKFKDYLI
jgi:hypothetical protein